MRRRIPPGGPRLASSPQAVKDDDKLKEEDGTATFPMFVAFLFSLSFVIPLILPSIVAGHKASTLGRTISMGGFLLAVGSVALAIFLPGGLHRHGVAVVAAVAAGFGFMIGGIVGDSVRFW